MQGYIFFGRERERKRLKTPAMPVFIQIGMFGLQKKKKKKINEIIENATVASGLEQMAVSQEELPGVVLPINQIGRVTSSEGSEAASLSPAPLAPAQLLL